MAEHCGYVVKVEKLRPHSNADRLQILTVFSTDVIVSLDVKVGDVIEIAFGQKAVKVRVLDIQDTTKKDEAKDLFEYIS